NATAIGMEGRGGQVLTASQMAGADWAFDAVYTPVDTGFLRSAHSAGLEVLSGYELFFWQGVHAWDLFAGRPVDPAQLRAAIATR
ncbi:MAG: shikimate dehydrogenase, partial [Pseudomonadota bacterium]